MGIRFTSREDEIIAKMWTAGEKATVIAATICRPYYSTVHRVYRLGLRKRTERIQSIFSASDVERMVSMWAQGRSHKEIGDALGFSDRQINRKLKEIRRGRPDLVPFRYNVKREVA